HYWTVCARLSEPASLHGVFHGGDLGLVRDTLARRLAIPGVRVQQRQRGWGGRPRPRGTPWTRCPVERSIAWRGKIRPGGRLRTRASAPQHATPASLAVA